MADPEIIKGEAPLLPPLFLKNGGEGGAQGRAPLFLSGKGVGAPLDSMLDPSLLTTIFKLCLEPISISYFSFGGCIHLKFETLTQHMFMPLANYYFSQLNRPL